MTTVLTGAQQRPFEYRSEQREEQSAREGEVEHIAVEYIAAMYSGEVEHIAAHEQRHCRRRAAPAAS